MPPSEPAAARSSLVFLVVLATLVAVLSIAGGAAGYVLGSRSGVDVAAARLAGKRQGERLAAAQLRPQDRRRASRAGEKEGSKATYGRAYRDAQLECPRFRGHARANG